MSEELQAPCWPQGILLIWWEVWPDMHSDSTVKKASEAGPEGDWLRWVWRPRGGFSLHRPLVTHLWDGGCSPKLRAPFDVCLFRNWGITFLFCTCHVYLPLHPLKIINHWRRGRGISSPSRSPGGLAHCKDSGCVLKERWLTMVPPVKRVPSSSPGHPFRLLRLSGGTTQSQSEEMKPLGSTGWGDDTLEAVSLWASPCPCCDLPLPKLEWKKRTGTQLTSCSQRRPWAPVVPFLRDTTVVPEGCHHLQHGGARGGGADLTFLMKKAGVVYPTAERNVEVTAVDWGDQLSFPLSWPCFFFKSF